MYISMNFSLWLPTIFVHLPRSSLSVFFDPHPAGKSQDYKKLELKRNEVEKQVQHIILHETCKWASIFYFALSLSNAIELVAITASRVRAKRIVLFSSRLFFLTEQRCFFFHFICDLVAFPLHQHYSLCSSVVGVSAGKVIVPFRSLFLFLCLSTTTRWWLTASFNFRDLLSFY